MQWRQQRHENLQCLYMWRHAADHLNSTAISQQHNPAAAHLPRHSPHLYRPVFSQTHQPGVNKQRCGHFGVRSRGAESIRSHRHRKQTAAEALCAGEQSEGLRRVRPCCGHIIHGKLSPLSAQAAYQAAAAQQEGLYCRCREVESGQVGQFCRNTGLVCYSVWREQHSEQQGV